MFRRAAEILVVGLCSTGCVKQMLINGQIEGTRQASVAFDTIGDFELEYNAASFSIVQFEGMRVLAPDNTDALFLLTKAWTGYGFAFAEDDLEEAQDNGERALETYHRDRAVNAYARAIEYGLALLAEDDRGFDEARKT